MLYTDWLFFSTTVRGLSSSGNEHSNVAIIQKHAQIVQGAAAAILISTVQPAALSAGNMIIN